MENTLIRILPAAQIDRSLWDRCIQQDAQAKVYNYSAYLDCFAPNWQGLVVGDYQACLALPFYKRLGSKWLQMPPFIQQFNLASQTGCTLNNAIKLEIGLAICKQYRLIRYCCTGLELATQPFKSRTNYVLNLAADYEQISSGFNKNGRKNIRRAEALELKLVRDVPVETVIQFYKAAYGSLSRIKDEAYLNFVRLSQTESPYFKVHTYGVQAADGNLVLAALVLEDAKALYYVLAAPNEAGRNQKATYFFINELIRQNAGKALKLDFEGSDLKNVADFYLSFGPEAEPYYYYQHNNYPLPLKPVIRAISGV